MAKRSQNVTDEERGMNKLIRHVYGDHLNDFLDKCFDKKIRLPVSASLRSKRVTFKPKDLFTHEKWKDIHLEDLQNLKRKLNSVKERLNEYDLNEWHKHTKAMNPADLVMRRLRSDMKVEFLTQAWCKFYELVYTFNLIPRSAKLEKKFYTIHLCEAPGAFVASLNHYLKLNHPDIEWHWKANSLNPYYEGNHSSEMISDDRFMLQTIDNWDFGPDMTGDITHPDYPDYLLQQCGDYKPHLITADGSFDCQDQPEEQELSVSWLNLKETLAALRILRKGGHFVIKMFTFFECDTICLLYLLACSFISIDIMKPATSKEGNSEVYVICREFKDDEIVQLYLDQLLKISYEDHKKYAMFPFKHINRIFLNWIVGMAQKFAKIQMSIIERNILHFPNTSNSVIKEMREFLQEKLYEKYIETYEIKPIALKNTIVRIPYRKKGYVTAKVIEQRNHKQGSHTDQVKRSSMVRKELLQKILEELPPSLMKFPEPSVMPKVDLLFSNFIIRTGKPISAVCSSQFCHGTYIRIRNELISAIGLIKYNISVADVDGKESVEKSDHEICDFTVIYMTISNYSDAQLECFNILYDRLATMVDHENLILLSFPLLTQFNVSLMCVLGQFFEKIRFVPPNTIYLHDLNAKKKNLWMTYLTKLYKEYDKHKAVISFLPIHIITGVDNAFYSWIIDINNVRVLTEIRRTEFYFNPCNSV